VDPAERLASYLAGELAADEHAAVEAELAHDPALRAQLEALQRADAALAGLSSPQPPAGFEDRLTAAVEAVLAETVRGAHATADAELNDSRDELAARRDRDRRWSWKPAFAGAAAAVVLLVAGIAISGLGGDDEGVVGEVALDAPAEEPDATMEMDEDAGEAPVEDGPLVVVSGREVDEEAVDALLSAPAVSELARRGLGDVEGAQVAVGWQAALGATALLDENPVELRADEGADAAQPEEEGAIADDSPQASIPPSAERRLAEDRVPTADDDRALTRCLDDLLTAESRAIPTYVEFVSYDDEKAIVFGLVTLDPTSGAYTRTEAWVLRRDDCRMLRFSQDG